MIFALLHTWSHVMYTPIQNIGQLCDNELFTSLKIYGLRLSQEAEIHYPFNGICLIEAVKNDSFFVDIQLNGKPSESVNFLPTFFYFNYFTFYCYEWRQREEEKNSDSMMKWKKASNLLCNSLDSVDVGS